MAGGGCNLKHKAAVTAALMLQKRWSQWRGYVGFSRPRQNGEDRASPVGGMVREFRYSASVSAVAAPFKEGENRWA